MSTLFAAPPPLKTNAGSFEGLRPETVVELIQTHIGYVYLVGDVAYKLKKPVTYDFLDFSTLEKRKWALERELLLNRRLCPDLYLNLYPVIEKPDGSRVVSESGAAGTVVDWALKMKRMPQERMLNALLDRDAVTVEHVAAIARTLAPFYSQQRGVIAPGGLGDLDAVRFNIDENLREGAALPPEILPPEQLKVIDSRARRFLEKYGELIHARAVNGFVADGHGDLRSENICLPKDAPPLLFDCIEFNDRFRVCDSALDIAYLVMEFDTRGRGDLARAFSDAYRSACDPELSPVLLDFYLGYRAFIKGKVDAWISGDTGIPADVRRKHTEAATRYFDFSLSYSLRSEPILLVFCGVSGSGKSTLAREAAARLHATHFSTDLIRDELIPRGTPPETRYSAEASARVYGEALARADKQLRSDLNRIVILDGTFSTQAIRSRALKLAKESGARAWVVHAACSEETTAAHMRERLSKGQLGGSEATPAIAASQRSRFDAPTESEGFQGALTIDTSRPIEESKSILWKSLCNSLSASSAL